MCNIATDKYGILADYLYIRPINEYIVLSAEKPEETAFAENYDPTDLCGTGIKLDIINKAYPASGFDADYFLAPDIAEMTHHNITVR